jgi:LacI family transcriptional regulator
MLLILLYKRNVSRLWGVNIAATIKDVAKHTGLSIATISKYINGGNVLDNNRVAIDQAIRELDFKVNEIARGLKTNRTMTIGVLIPDLKNIFCTTIVSNIESILLQNGYSTIICDYQQNSGLEKEKFEFLINKLVDGIITIPYGIDAQCIKDLMRKNIPVVLIDRAIKEVSCDTVLADNLNASYNAVEQLIIKGHKRIGIICGPDNIFTAQERLKGYVRVYEDYSLKMDESLVKKGDYEVESGYSLLNELLDSINPPTAVFVTNYEMTLGAIMAINERNVKMPEELSFIGFDNLQMAKVVKPMLTIVVQPMEQIGETAANILLKRLKGDMSGFPAMFRLKTELISKDSVKELKD